MLHIVIMTFAGNDEYYTALLEIDYSVCIVYAPAPPPAQVFPEGFGLAYTVKGISLNILYKRIYPFKYFLILRLSV